MRFVHFVLFLAFTGIACADAGGEIADGINDVICLFVRLIWLVTGSLMALVIIFAGVKWLVSGGDAGARASAKTFIVSAFVGLIIIFTAVPVVDYLVGGILGYEFWCGFFSDNFSPDFLKSSGSGDDGTVFVPLSVEDDPLSEYPDFMIEDIVVPPSSGGLNGGYLPFCVVVKENGYSGASGVRVVADLEGAGYSLYSETVCDESLSVSKGGRAYVNCRITGDGFESIDGDSAGYLLSAGVNPDEGDGKHSVLEKDYDNNLFEAELSGLKEDSECTGDPPAGKNPDEKLAVKSPDDEPYLKLHIGLRDWGSAVYYPDEIDLMQKDVLEGRASSGEGDQVVLYAELKGAKADDFEWITSWGYTPPNQQLLSLDPKTPGALPTKVGEYEITLKVREKGTGEVYTRTGRINVLPFKLGVGLAAGGGLDYSGKPLVINPGTKGTVVLHVLWPWSKSPTYTWDLQWGYTVDGNQMIGLDPNKDAKALPQNTGDYRVTVTASSERGTFEDSVVIKVRDFQVFDVVMVPVGYSFPRDLKKFESQVAEIKKAWLDKSPLRDCSDAEDRVRYHLLDSDCTNALNEIKKCNNNEDNDDTAIGKAQDYVGECGTSSRYKNILDKIQGIYNGDLGAGCSNIYGSSGYGSIENIVSGEGSKAGLGVIAAHEMGHGFELCKGNQCYDEETHCKTNVRTGRNEWDGQCKHCASESCIMYPYTDPSRTEFCAGCYAVLKQELKPYLEGCSK